jgi:hypothetical protein
VLEVDVDVGGEAVFLLGMSKEGQLCTRKELMPQPSNGTHEGRNDLSTRDIPVS